MADWDSYLTQDPDAFVNEDEEPEEEPDPDEEDPYLEDEDD